MESSKKTLPSVFVPFQNPVYFTRVGGQSHSYNSFKIEPGFEVDSWPLIVCFVSLQFTVCGAFLSWLHRPHLFFVYEEKICHLQVFYQSRYKNTAFSFNCANNFFH